MSLEAGQLLPGDEFANPDCMARYMEEALLALNGPPPDPADSGKRGRRLFFIAISTGVIDYLKQHDADSFLVRDASNNVLNQKIEIL